MWEILHVYFLAINPSDAEATFVQKTPRFLENV